MCRKDSRKSFFLKGDDFFLNLTGGITPALFGGTYTEKGGGKWDFHTTRMPEFYRTVVGLHSMA